jgi:dipeptidyl aminopeptidase/acylaminoacyl peptidase
MPPLEALYSRPLAWGTSPTNLRWSKTGHVLGFLWNAEGMRFKDLYVWHADGKKLVRLTDLESQKDELNMSEAEKDARLRHYVPPPAGLSSFDLSDDGRIAAFSYKGDLYIVETSTAKLKRLTRTKPAELDAKLSSDGRLLASVRGGQLMVQNLETGELWQVTQIESGTGSLEDYKWAPDGKSVLYTVRKGSVRRMPLPNYSGTLVTARQVDRTLAGDEPAAMQVFLVGVEGGDSRAIDRGNWGDKTHIVSLEWSPDSKRVLIAQLEAGWKRRQILAVDAETSKARVLFEEHDPKWVDYGFAGWSPDSRQVFFTSEKDGWAHLYRVGVGGGEATQLTRGAYEIRSDTFSEDPQWVRDGIYYSSNEGDTAQRQFYRIAADGTGKEKLSSQEGLNIGLVTEDGHYTAMRRADESNPFDVWVNGERVTMSPRAEFYKHPWPQVRYVNFPSRGDGKTVAAKMLLPPGYNPDDKSQAARPAIVYIHGAGIATSVLKQWGSYNELRYVFNAYLASKGYVILDLDYRGSTGYGRDWRSGVYLHMGGKDLEDVLGGVEYLRSLGNIDMKRIGIWGVSYGGFMTNMALFLAPGTFRAGSSWAAVNDWENYNAGYTAQRLNTPASNPEAYRRSSPIHFTGNLQDRLLIVHGMVDDNVLFQDAVQLAEKLIHERKEFAHIFYPQESHGFVRDETWIDALRRTLEWFDRYLQ